MHVLVLKLDTPKSSYGLSNLTTVITVWHLTFSGHFMKMSSHFNFARIYLGIEIISSMAKISGQIWLLIMLCVSHRNLAQRTIRTSFLPVLLYTFLIFRTFLTSSTISPRVRKKRRVYNATMVHANTLWKVTYDVRLAALEAIKGSLLCILSSRRQLVQLSTCARHVTFHRVFAWTIVAFDTLLKNSWFDL